MLKMLSGMTLVNQIKLTANVLSEPLASGINTIIVNHVLLCSVPHGSKSQTERE